jgi:hypothetical protein
VEIENVSNFLERKERVLRDSIFSTHVLQAATNRFPNGTVIAVQKKRTDIFRIANGLTVDVETVKLSLSNNTFHHRSFES